MPYHQYVVDLSGNTSCLVLRSLSRLFLPLFLSTAETACSLADFTTLCQLIGVFELEDTLSEGTWTVFAPTNEAFAAIADVVAALEPEVILDILLFHAVPDQALTSSDLVCDGFLTMANGEDSQTICDEEAGTIFQVGPGNAAPNLPLINPADLPVCNGILHVVDNVLLPGDDDGSVSPPSDAVIVEVFIEFDGFATETGWEITDSNGDTVMMVPFGTYPPKTESTTEEVELASGSTYSFTIFDVFGDGLSNPEDGSYSVTQGDTELVSGGGNFGREETTEFTTA